MKFSPLVNRIGGKGSQVWETHFRAQRYLKEGKDVILLTVGDPDMAPPQAILDAACDSLQRHRTGYTPISGYPEVLDAISARQALRTGQPCSSKNVICVPGAQAGLFCVLQVIASAGDEVIVPEPMYATYAGVAGASGATIVTVPLKAESDFHLHVADIEKAITSRTRAVWINSPHNPTGAVMTREEIEAVSDICRRHDLWLISDEVYADLTFNDDHVSPYSLPDMASRTIVISSLSKSHAIPGFRFGWIIAPEEMIAHLNKLLLCMLYGGPAFIQDGALVALTQDMPEVKVMQQAYKRRAAIVIEELAGIEGLRTNRPQGGMFVLLDIRESGMTSDEYAYQLLEDVGVALVPCDGFGDSAKGHLRLSLGNADETIRDACGRIRRFAQSLLASSSSR